MSSSSVSSSSVVEPRPVRLLSSSASSAASISSATSPPSPSSSDPLLLSALSEPKSRSLLLSCEDELLSLLSAHSSAHSYTIHDVSSFQRMLLTRLGRRWGFQLVNAHDAEASRDDSGRPVSSAGGSEQQVVVAAAGMVGTGEDSLTFIRTAQSRPPSQLLSELAKQTEAEERSFRSRSPGGASSVTASATSSPASLKIMQRASSTEPGAPSPPSGRGGVAGAGGSTGAAADSDVDEEAAIRQREEEYERIRARIFADENEDDDVWRSVSIRRDGEQMLSDAGGAVSVGESALSEGGTDSGRMRDEAAKKKSMDVLARLDSTAGDDSRSKKVGSGVEAADMHLYNRRLYPANVKPMTPYSLPFYPSSAAYPAMTAAAFSQPQYYPTSQQYMPSMPLPQPTTAALNTADLSIQAAINKLRQQQSGDPSMIVSPSSASPSASARSSASSMTSPTSSSSPVSSPPTVLTQAQRAAGFVDVATLQQMNANAPVFTPAHAKQHSTHATHYPSRGMAAMPAGMQFVPPQSATALSQLPSTSAASSLPYAASAYTAAASSTPQLPQGFRAVRPANPTPSPYARNTAGYGAYSSQPSLPSGAPYQPLSGNAYGYQHQPYNQLQQSQQQSRPSALSPSNAGAAGEPSQRSPLVESGSAYPMYINTFPSSSSLSPSSQTRPQPSSNSPSPIAPPSAAASSIRSRALSLPTSSDPILEQPLPSRRYSHVMDGNVPSLSSLSLSSSASPTVSSPSFSSANDPIVQPSTLSASLLSSPSSIQQQQKQHTLFSSPTASSSPFSPFSFQSSPFLSSASSDQVTGAPLFSLTPPASHLTSPTEQRRDMSDAARQKELDVGKRREEDAAMSAAVSPLRPSASSPNSAAGSQFDVVFRSAPKLFISNSNSNGPSTQQLTATDTTEAKSREQAAGATKGRDNGGNEQERGSRVRDIPFVPAPAFRLISPSPSPPPAITSNPVISIYPSSMQPAARKVPSSTATGVTAQSSSAMSQPSTSVSFASMVRHSLSKHTPAASSTATVGNTVPPSLAAVVTSSPLAPSVSSSPSSTVTSPAASSAPVIHKNPLITIRPSAWGQGLPAASHKSPSLATPAASSSSLSASLSSAGASAAASHSSPAPASSPADPVWTAVGGGGRRK